MAGMFRIVRVPVYLDLLLLLLLLLFTGEPG
jgi:hypothetical protein